jgi:hypothetical protein
MFVVRLHGRPAQPPGLRRARSDADLLASGGEHLPVLLVQAQDFQLNCGQFQGLAKLIMAGLLSSAVGCSYVRRHGSQRVAFLPLGCLPSVVLGPAVLLVVPGSTRAGCATSPVPGPCPGGGRAWRRERLRGDGAGPRRGQPLSVRGVDEILAMARRRAGLEHASCHELRHTCLTRLREAGMALEAVQAQAGHASIESTRIYLHLADDWLAAQYRKAAEVIDAQVFAGHPARPAAVPGSSR